ncbi:MAG: hypothetical protein FJ291_00440 [Planctomycetes bacterium]|nr:hypothetical protein [Planctomycetota bacterium]
MSTDEEKPGTGLQTQSGFSAYLCYKHAESCFPERFFLRVWLRLAAMGESVEREKFRAEQRAVRARFDAQIAGGKHTYEKGLRNERVLIDFLRTNLPPCYGAGYLMAR